MATNFKKIFFSNVEIVEFETNLRTMVDSILTFVKYDISITPLTIKSAGISSKEVKEYKEWLVNAPSFTIIDIVTGVISNKQGKINAKNSIKNIILDAKNKIVKIEHNQDIDVNDIYIIENILASLMFDYYSEKIIESRYAKNTNRRIAQQSQQAIFANIHKHVRHGKNSR